MLHCLAPAVGLAARRHRGRRERGESPLRCLERRLLPPSQLSNAHDAQQRGLSCVSCVSCPALPSVCLAAALCTPKQHPQPRHFPCLCLCLCCQRPPLLSFLPQTRSLSSPRRSPTASIGSNRIRHQCIRKRERVDGADCRIVGTSGSRMEAEAPVQASHSAKNRTPESLRQRQRDRMSPRGRFAKTTRISTTIREIDGAPKGGITLAPAPRSKTIGNRSPELTKKKQLQEGLRKENSINRRARREAEDLKFDITPDGGSAGREGRQFTVAKVGNNGKIYLR
jgi:hypothetical protein